MRTLPADLITSHQEIVRLRGTVEKRDREIAYLNEQLRLTRLKFFGKSSEKRPLEGSSQQVTLFPLEPRAPKAEKTEKISYTRKKRRVEGNLPEGVRFPDYLERKDEVVDEGEGEVRFVKITERLAANVSQFYVKRIIRQIRSRDGSLTSPAVPPAVLERTSVDVSFLVYIVLAKYMWHLPLHRQEQMLKAQGISISRDTLIRYVIRVAFLLKPIYVALGEGLFSLDHLFADETPVLVGKKKGERKSYSNGYFWTFLGGLGCIFYYTPTRAYREVEPLIKTFAGDLQVDGYGVYDRVSRNNPEITLVGCWSHARRKFIDAESGDQSDSAREALRYIRVLYRVERWAREKKLPPLEKLKLRQRFSKRVLRLFHRWLKDRIQTPQFLPRNAFGRAVAYTLKRCEALSRYLENPELAIDSNSIEREIRPSALGKKNWLFCASEEGAEASAILYSLIASCKLAGVDPAAYLTDVLERISDHPSTRVQELIPANWARLIEEEKKAAA